MHRKISVSARLAALVAATALVFTGCSSAPADNPSDAAKASESITMTDSWVKAADEGMSAAFGTLENESDQDITVVSATSPASTMLELHETVANEAGEMTMREVEGGFVIPAHSSFELKPGGNHIMLMDLPKPLKAGETASFTITFSDKSSMTFEAPVKDYSGANENYEGGDHGGMDHGGSDHEGHDHSDSGH